MKSCLITLLLFLLMGCDVLAPLPIAREQIYQLDNSPDFGIGNFSQGFDFGTGSKRDTANLILSPYSNTEGEVLGLMLFDPKDTKEYRLDFRFEESHAEASHYFKNYEVLKETENFQKVFKFQEGTIATANQYQYDTLALREYKAQKNDVFIYDNWILLHILGTFFRSYGYVNVYFKYRRINEN